MSQLLSRIEQNARKNARARRGGGQRMRQNEEERSYVYVVRLENAALHAHIEDIAFAHAEIGIEEVQETGPEKIAG